MSFGLLFTVWTWWTPLLVWWMWTRKSAGKKWFVRWNRPLPKTQSWILSCKMSGKLENPQNYLDRRLSKSNPSRLRNAMQLHKKRSEKMTTLCQRIWHVSRCVPWAQKGNFYLLLHNVPTLYWHLYVRTLYSPKKKLSTLNDQSDQNDRWNSTCTIIPLYASWWMCIEVTWPPNILLR